MLCDSSSSNNTSCCLTPFGQCISHTIHLSSLPFTPSPFPFSEYTHSSIKLFSKNNTLSAIVNLNRLIFHKAGHNWLTGEMITTENESARAYPFPFPLRLSNPLSFAVIKVWSLKAGDISTAQVPQVQFPPQRSAYSLFTIDPTLNGNCSTLYSLQ